MKKGFLFAVVLFLMMDMHAQNVGVGTTLPQAKLHIAGGLLSDGTIGSTPVSGGGTRMMWIPAKAAFRAGFVDGTQWNDANIGSHSFASGRNSLASNSYCTAMGDGATASGYSSIAIGTGNAASGGWSSAMGFSTNASGQASTAMGSWTIAGGDYSTAIGTSTSASGYFSTATGHSTTSKSYGGFTTGLFNDNADAADPFGINSFNRIFQIGNGTADNARSNAMTVLQNGNVGINTTTPQSLLQVKNGAVLFDGTTGTTPISGGGTRMMWIPAKAAFRAGFVDGTQWNDANIGSHSFASGRNSLASNSYCTAMGDGATASGYVSTAMGSGVLASGGWSTAMGFSTNASGQASTAMGSWTIAGGDYSTAIGTSTSASGYFSTATGHSTTSKSYAGFTTGLFNDNTDAADPLGINSFNRIFQIGNGTADNARSNAMTVLQNGNVGIGVLTPSQMLEIAGNLTVQNGKGIIRTADGTQKKELTTSAVVNVTLAAGATTSVSFTFSESFSSIPDVFVGNILSGAGGWAEVIMSVTNITTTGGILYVHNPRTISWSPNYTVRIIAIGPQ